VAAIPAVALVLDLPSELVLARNAAREGRVVDPAIVRQHHETLRNALARDALRIEGWTAIIVLTDAAGADALAIERLPRAPAPA
jgi:predicted kinase